MTNRVSCFCLPFSVGVQRNVVYYITSFSVCQGVLEAFFDFLFREPIPFPNRLGSALPKEQLTSSRRSAQRHLLYHIQLLLSRGFWKISDVCCLFLRPNRRTRCTLNECSYMILQIPTFVNPFPEISFLFSALFLAVLS